MSWFDKVPTIAEIVFPTVNWLICHATDHDWFYNTDKGTRKCEDCGKEEKLGQK